MGAGVAGQSAGSDNGYSETLTWLTNSTNLPNLLSNLTSMMQWVRSGFAPKNTALQNASYSGDPSTADANGNAWPGGGPGIGAMAYNSGVVLDPIEVASDTSSLCISVP